MQPAARQAFAKIHITCNKVEPVLRTFRGMVLNGDFEDHLIRVSGMSGRGSGDGCNERKSKEKYQKLSETDRISCPYLCGFHMVF